MEHLIVLDGPRMIGVAWDAGNALPKSWYTSLTEGYEEHEADWVGDLEH